MDSAFVLKHQTALEAYWARVRPEIAGWRARFDWPVGVGLDGAIARRQALEDDVRTEVKNLGAISKATFDAVMRWGFNKESHLTENEILKATHAAFAQLKAGNLKEAALTLMELRGVGISTASKVLALADQDALGIYDSRVAHGLSDLELDGERALRIPLGYVVKGDLGTRPAVFAEHFERMNAILAFFRDLAQADPGLRRDFSRVADFEMAFFARSRAGLLPLGTPQPVAAPPAGQTFYTLGREAPFGVEVEAFGLAFQGQGTPTLLLTHAEIEACLDHFGDGTWFPLGASRTDPDPDGLGAYLQSTFGVSPQHASYLAGYFVATGVWQREGRRPVMLRLPRADQEPPKEVPQPAQEVRPVSKPLVFVSYCQKDAAMCDELVEQVLKPYKQQGFIDYWYDQNLEPGIEMEQEIMGKLQQAAAVIFLVSPQFCSSWFIQTKELPAVLEAAKAGKTKVFWLLLKPMDLSLANDLKQLQAVENPSKPLSGMNGHGRSEVWAKLGTKLRALSTAPVQVSAVVPQVVAPPPRRAERPTRGRSGISIVQRDLAQQTADAIIVSASKDFSATGGMEKAIHQAAGPDLRSALSRQPQLRVAETCVTPGFALQTKTLVHTLAPRWRGEPRNDLGLLHETYDRAFDTAIRAGARTIALGSLGVGHHKFPAEVTGEIAIEAARRALARGPEGLEIRFVVQREDVQESLEQALLS